MGLPHSKTSRKGWRAIHRDSVLECGCPLPLSLLACARAAPFIGLMPAHLKVAIILTLVRTSNARNYFLFTRREYRCRSEPHRFGCGGSTPPSRRVLFAPRTRAAEYPPLKRKCQGASPCRSTNFASVVKLLSSSASNGEFAGESPAGCTILIEG
jgi:hypothetical protein